MKIFNLFLILIMLACYSGLCSSPPNLASSVELKSESCHEMGNNQASQNNNQLVKTSNQTASDISACCFDTLLNSVDDDYTKDFAKLTPTAFNPNYTITKYDLRIKDISLREHDPPNLQVLHSTFQI